VHHLTWATPSRSGPDTFWQPSRTGPVVQLCFFVAYSFPSNVFAAAATA
jgi:hypothetical protein